MNMALSSRGAFGSAAETNSSNALSSGWVTSAAGGSDPFGSSKSSTQQYRPPSVAGRFGNFGEDSGSLVGSAMMADDGALNNGAFAYRSNSNQFDAVKPSGVQRSLASAMMMGTSGNNSMSQSSNSSGLSFPSATSAFGSYGFNSNSMGAASNSMSNRMGSVSSNTNGGTPPPTLGAGSAMALHASQLSQLAALSSSRSSGSQANGLMSSNALFGAAASGRLGSTSGPQNGSAASAAASSSSWMSLGGSGSGSGSGSSSTLLGASQSQAGPNAGSSANVSANALLRAAFQAGPNAAGSPSNMQMLVNHIMMMNQNQPGDASSGVSGLKEAPPALLDPSAFPTLAGGRVTPPLLNNGPSGVSVAQAQSVASLSLAAFGPGTAGAVGSTRTYVSAVGGRPTGGDVHASAQEFSIQPDDFPALPVAVSRPNNAIGLSGSIAQSGVEQLGAAFSSMQLGTQSQASVTVLGGNEVGRSIGGVGSMGSQNSADRFGVGNAAAASGSGSGSGSAGGRNNGGSRTGGGLNTDGTIQLATSIIADHFGMLGVLSFLKAAEQDQEAVQLASGIDLTSLGVNVTASDPLYTSFASPWSDTPAKPQDIDWNVPAEYITSPFMRDKFPPPSMSRYADDQLFFIFYVMVGDAQQLLAAAELYSRDWRFHKEERVWVTRISNMEPSQKTSAFERGMYYYFDASKWTRVPKEMTIEYDKLEEKPQFSLGASQHTMMTAAAKMASTVHPHKLVGAGGSGGLGQGQVHGAASGGGGGGGGGSGSGGGGLQQFGVSGGSSGAGVGVGMNQLAMAGGMKPTHGGNVTSNMNLPPNVMFSVPSLN